MNNRNLQFPTRDFIEELDNTSCVPTDAPGCLEKPGKHCPANLPAAAAANQALPRVEAATKSSKPPKSHSWGSCGIQEQDSSLIQPWLSLWGQQQEGQGAFGVWQLQEASLSEI